MNTKPNTATFDLHLKITYALNGETPANMRRELEELIPYAANNCLLTGETMATVESHSVGIVEEGGAAASVKNPKVGETWLMTSPAKVRSGWPCKNIPVKIMSENAGSSGPRWKVRSADRWNGMGVAFSRDWFIEKVE